eukprot:11978814-Alexandrium_andersonii.AAC.2
MEVRFSVRRARQRTTSAPFRSADQVSSGTASILELYRVSGKARCIMHVRKAIKLPHSDAVTPSTARAERRPKGKGSKEGGGEG